jgi:hypothetical protein
MKPPHSPQGRPRVADALDRLTEFYAATGNQTEAAIRIAG